MYSPGVIIALMEGLTVFLHFSSLSLITPDYTIYRETEQEEGSLTQEMALKLRHKPHESARRARYNHFSLNSTKPLPALLES